MAEDREFNVVIQMLITATDEEQALSRAVDDINETFLAGTLDAYISEDGTPYSYCVVTEEEVDGG